ncbi:MAG TPA: transglutaminase-like domain-containing protein [Acidimicrobiia bacterium]|nr:transglutaminase-like domain-containing protein [Acidimicrobiia bacterium]
MDPTERFAALVQRPSREIALAEAALWIAAHDHTVDVAEHLGALDSLAAGTPDPANVAEHLFTTCGFAGNVQDYLDPGNSYLDAVLTRRVGIPITLSVVMIEVGRRIGTEISGIGMPGHFLVRDATGTYFDPFHGGARLEEDGCRHLFETMHGPGSFAPQYLDPVDDRAILARMLANLTRSFIERRPRDALWAVRLRGTIPGLSVADRRHDATVLGTLGGFREASALLATLATEVDAAGADELLRESAAYRARAN